MRSTHLNFWKLFSAGAIVTVAGCSSDDTSNQSVDSGLTSTGGSVANGTGGRSTGGAVHSGGATHTGGTTSTGGTTGTGGSSGGTDGGTDASAGGADAGSGTGGTGTGGAGTGGAGTGGAGTGGTGTGGAGTGGAGAGGTGTGGAGPGGAGTGGAGTGGAGTGGAGTGGADAGPRHKRVFVTSGTWTGDLVHSVTPAAADGLAAADKLCNIAATSGSLGGTWVAWLSDSTHNAIDRISDVGPWYRIDDIKVFNNKAALTGNPAVPIDVNETGTGITNFYPWTGTKADGTKAATNCSDWTEGTSGTGECGSSAADLPTWTEFSGLSCTVPYNLYCFEQ